MSLWQFIKSSLVLQVDQRLTNIFTSKNCNSTSKILRNGNNWSQERGHRRFARQPIKVLPAKKDEGKISMVDYIGKTYNTVNQEVIDEARMISRMTQQQQQPLHENHTLETEIYDSENKFAEKNTNNEEYHEHNRMDSNSKSAKSHKSKNASKKVVLLDEAKLRNAELTKKLNAQIYAKAPSIYRSLLSDCRTAKSRAEHDIVMVEGPKLLQETITAGLTPEAVYFSRKRMLLDIMPKRMDCDEKIERLMSYPLIRTPYNVLTRWSSVVKGHGLIGVFRLSEAASVPKKQQLTPRCGAPVTVVLDGVREPGNLGAILRTVAAVGATKVVLIKGCCDAWSGKVLRAASGGHFSLEVVDNITWDAIYNTITSTTPDVYLADICNGDRERLVPVEDDFLEEMSDSGDNDVELGDDIMKTLRKKDQMNFMNRMSRDVDASEVGVSSRIVSEIDEDGETLTHDDSFYDEELVDRYSNVRLPSASYNEINFFPNAKVDDDTNIVLVIGSETGLSNYSKKFATDHCGMQVSIPLLNSMDSLNTSVASGVILYEILNQAQKLYKLQTEHGTHEVISSN